MKFLQFSSLIYLFLVFSVACKENGEEIEVKHFYVEIEDQWNSPRSRLIIDALEDYIESGDYFISEESANKGWPYYKKVERGERVNKEEIVPPHTKINRLTRIDKLSDRDLKQGDLKLEVSLELINNDSVNLTKRSLIWQNDSWQSFAKPLTDSFNPGMEDQALLDQLGKTLIRYTFK